MMILGVSGKDVSVARHVLVTGGAGYVGSHACKALASAGYTPIAYDNLVHGHEWAVRWGPLEKGDILDKVRLDRKSTRLNSSHSQISYAVFCLKKKKSAQPTLAIRNEQLL